MIEREEVRHVARLARLALSDEEVDRMAVELAGVLDHIATIEQLDLDAVEPTSHVVAVENALRVLLALGGSTNAVIHLTAIAGRAGVDLPLRFGDESLDLAEIGGEDFGGFAG